MIHEQQFAAYVGLDWGDQRHSVHLQVSGQPKAESFELEQKPEALHEWVARLVERFQGGWIAIAIEQRKGAVIHALMMYAFFVLFPINPKALARYREALYTSGARERSHRFGAAAGFLDQAFRKTSALDSRFRADARTTGPVRATPKTRQSTRGSDQSHHQSPQAVFPTGSGLDRRDRLHSSLRFSGGLVHSRRRSSHRPQPTAHFLSPSQLPQGLRDLRTPGPDRSRTSSHQRLGHYRTLQPDR